MAGSTNDKSKLAKRIFLGAGVLVLGGSMLLYLVPQGPATGEVSTDTVARVGDESVTLDDIRQQLQLRERNNQVPEYMRALLAQEIFQGLVFQKELDYEAKRMGITVSDQELADRIRLFLPMAVSGGSFIGKEQYAALVQQNFQLTVPAFEDLVRQGLLEEKFRKLVTDGISVGPAELQEGYRHKNEKVKLDYALVKPEDLEAQITPSDAEIKAEYEKNKARYQVPERRSVRYALLDVHQLRQTIQIPDEVLKKQYMDGIQQYQVPSQVHVQHILFKTVGKTDAEVEEIRKTAEDVLKQAKKGTKFDELAKKYSEDPGSKDKGGDLSWIRQGQTVPEFEKTAFSLAPGQISDLVRTQYGFHIIKVLEKQTAHTKPFEEVKESLRTQALLNQAERQATDTVDQMSRAIRQSNKTSLDDLAKQYHLVLGQTRPVSASDPLLELANAQDVKDEIFRLRSGELSLPIHNDRGYVVLALKDVLPAHQGTLEEMRDRVIADLKKEQSVQQAKAKAEELARRVKGGAKFDQAAKALGLDAKTSDSISRDGSIPGAASGKQLSAAFHLKQGDVGEPLSLGQNWLVYRVDEKLEADPANFEAQKKQLTDELLQAKREVAFEAFRSALSDRLLKEGKLKLMPEKLKNFNSLT
jgi:peptidyl-prolyl cis-trans isomerase D